MVNVPYFSLFDAVSSSLKYFKTITGSWHQTTLSDHTETFPHNYTDDNIFVSGYVTVYYASNPSEVFRFNLPYQDVDGNNVMTATWDANNVYLEFANNGTVDVGEGENVQDAYWSWNIQVFIV